MTIAAGSRAQLAYIAETVYGTTPTSPVFKILPDSRNSVGLEKESFASERVRSDRQIVDFRHGTRSVAGDIPFEFCRDNYDEIMQAALMGTWAVVGDVSTLKAGVVRRSFTVETKYDDVTQYKRNTGCEVSTMSLEVAPNAMVTGSFGIVGNNGVMAQTALSGATYTPSPTTRVYDGFSGSIYVGSVEVGVITSVSLSLENNLENQAVVGRNTTVRGAAGMSNLTGEISAFFEDATLFDLFDDEQEVSIEFTLTDSVASYTFEMPRCKINGGKPEVGDDREVTISVPFQCLRDETEASQVVVTKVVL